MRLRPAGGQTAKVGLTRIGDIHARLLRHIMRYRGTAGGHQHQQ